jgi:tryptophan halogenase
MVRKVVVVGGGSAGFLAALALKVKMPDLRVIVIRSREIGIIGVGEGSTVPLTTFLHGYLNADLRALLKVAQPTLKMGLNFKGWGGRDHYYYPFGAQLDFRPAGLERNVAYYCDDDLEDATLEMAMIAREKVFFRGQGGQPQVHGKFAYHVENEKFVAYLEMFAKQSGVEIVEDTIEAVTQDEAGVKDLRLASGRVESGDLYVDCSGFKSLLLGKTLGEPFVSYSGSLFCDSAVVGGWERTNEPIHPYTTCEVMDGGWCWQIEHISRINRGYVYSSKFVTDEDARSEFLKKNPQIKGETRVIRFVSGRTARGWVKNVVAIGNASGFVEPLEATALGVIAARSQLVSQMLVECDRQVVPFQVELFNQSHARLWDSIRDFLACHYRFNDALGTPFWGHCRTDTDICGARPMVEYFQEFGPSGMWGPLLTDPLDGFGTKGYLMILVGQKVPYKRHHHPTPQESQAWDTLKRQYVEAAAGAMTVPEALQALGALGVRVQTPSPVTVAHVAAG